MLTFFVLELFVQVLFKKFVDIWCYLINLPAVYSQRLEASGFSCFTIQSCFSFFYFKPLATTLFTQLFCNSTYCKLEERWSGSNENHTTFLFSFHPNCLKAFKVKNCIWKQVSYRAVFFSFMIVFSSDYYAWH